MESVVKLLNERGILYKIFPSQFSTEYVIFSYKESNFLFSQNMETYVLTINDVYYCAYDQIDMVMSQLIRYLNGETIEPTQKAMMLSVILHG